MRFLMDAYRVGNKVVLWWKTPEGKNVREECSHTAMIYAGLKAKSALRNLGRDFCEVSKRNLLGKWRRVLAVPLKPAEFFRIVRLLERETRYRVPLYNADIAPEVQYLYEHNLVPCAGNPPLEVCDLDGGEEFNDPDVVLLDNPFHRLPQLALERDLPYHRWDPLPIEYRGGKTFFSYGRVMFRHFAIRLRGRFLLDRKQDPNTMMELCRLSGARLQHLASRSPGAVFQFSLVRRMYQEGLLVPYKQKPLGRPMSMFTLLKADRAGHTLDPKVGFHRNVAEVDFSSMFPWIMYNRNISAEMMLTDEEPREKVPGLPFWISHRRRGLVPQTVLPFLRRRRRNKKA